MKHISVDIETLSTKANPAIIQIGAVEFNLGDLADPEIPPLGREFLTNIHWKTAVDAGCKVDSATMKWWLDQSNEALDSVTDTSIMRPFLLGMAAFSAFFKETKARYIWGKPSTFDCSHLSEAYELAQMERPWHHKGEMCLRSVIQSVGRMNRVIPAPPVLDDPAFLKHNALWDAKAQAQFCQLGHRELAKGLQR